jgi:hypothetical protein
MAKVQGPLHSDIARGTFADQLTFRSPAGRPTCRKKPIRTVPLSEAQLIHHAAFSMLASNWRISSPENHATWALLNTPESASNYTNYIKWNLAQIAAGLPTSDYYPPNPDLPINAIITAGTPEANPDCTGDYTIIGTQNGYPLYARLQDFDYTLFYDDPWFIRRVAPLEPANYWRKSGTDPAGTYAHYGTFAGHPVVQIL